MRVLDLFAGTGSATQAFADRGHDVLTVDADDQFDVDIVTDVRELHWKEVVVTLRGRPHFIWASPPCTSFSTGSFRHHWDAITTCQTCGSDMRRAKGERWFHAYDPDCTKVRAGDLSYRPKSDTGRLGRDLLRSTLELIRDLNPDYFIIENPRALMRKMPEVQHLERRTITHCQYGDPRRMKPTDLFGVFPPGFTARACKNGAPCHEAAPRGSRNGTQGLSKVEGAMLPPHLSWELCAAVENAHAKEQAA